MPVQSAVVPGGQPVVMVPGAPMPFYPPQQQGTDHCFPMAKSAILHIVVGPAKGKVQLELYGFPIYSFDSWILGVVHSNNRATVTPF